MDGKTGEEGETEESSFGRGRNASRAGGFSTDSTLGWFLFMVPWFLVLENVSRFIRFETNSERNSFWKEAFFFDQVS